MDEHSKPTARATIWAGALIGIAGLLMVFDHAGSSLYVDDDYAFPFGGTIAKLIAALVLFVGFLIFAIVRRGGSRLAGQSPFGPTALAVFGALSLPGILLTSLPEGSGATRSWILVVVRLVVVAAGIYAARAVRRTALADRWTQLTLATAAWVLLAATVFQLLPVPMGLAVFTGVLYALALIALGAALMLDGRKAGVRERVAVIRKNW